MKNLFSWREITCMHKWADKAYVTQSCKLWRCYKCKISSAEVVIFMISFPHSFIFKFSAFFQSLLGSAIHNFFFWEKVVKLYPFITDRNNKYPISPLSFDLGDLCPRVWPKGALSVDSYRQSGDALSDCMHSPNKPGCSGRLGSKSVASWSAV